MQFGDDLESARAFSDKALNLMRDYDIPPTPSNFDIWYSYVSDRFPDLRQTIDLLITNEQPFTADQNARIHDRFFSHIDEGQAIQNATKQIDAQVSVVLSMLSEASDDAADFGNSLSGNLKELSESTGVDGIRAVIQALVQETRTMQKTSEELNSKLKESSEEIESLRQNLEDVQREAMTDALTGIANRKMFDGILRSATEAAENSGDPVSLAICDIDYFKKFNDTYGHQVGDQVLKLVARILKQSVKGRDLPARYGGEEFGIILPRTTIEDAHTLCEQIRESVSKKRIRNRQSGQEMGTITMSIGIATYRPGEPLSDLIQRADEGLYAAKRNGRNRTVVESQIRTE